MKPALNRFPHRRRVLPARAGICACLALVFGAAARSLAADAPGAEAPAPAPAAPAAPAGPTSFIFAPPKENVVLSVPAREKLLAAMTRCLERADPAMEARLKSSTNPFFVKLPPPPAAPGETTAASGTGVAVSAQLSDADKINQIAGQLKATGTLANTLVVPGKGLLPVGQFIEYTFPNEVAVSRIQLQSVSSNSYTLKLNDTVLAFPYVRKANATGAPLSSAAPAPVPTPEASPARAPAPPPTPSPTPSPSPSKSKP